MSLLSKKISEYIQESGETVQSLADLGNINRTTLQRVKSGERLPTAAFFKKMTKALRLSTTEVAELETLLEIAQVGEGCYANRQKIVELIEMISELTEYQIPFSKELRHQASTGVDPASGPALQIVTGPRAVQSLIEHCLDQELSGVPEPAIKLAIPYSFQAVYDYLFLQMLGNQKQLQLEDVISLHREADEAVADPMLGALKHLIALTLLDNVNYQSHCWVQPATPASPGQDIHCEAHCYRLARSVAFVDAEVWQDDRSQPIAMARATFMLSTPAGHRPGTGAPPPPAPASSWQPPAASETVQAGRPIPYADYLGIRVAPGVSAAAAPLYRLPYHEKLIGNPRLPALHGGVVAGFAETAAMLHLAQALQGAKLLKLPKGVDFAVDYLRAARPVETFAQCELVRVGARVALVQVRCWQSGPDNPIINARGHFVLAAVGGAEGGDAPR